MSLRDFLDSASGQAFLHPGDQPQPELRVVCMHCKGVLREGTPGALTSHGAHEACANEWLRRNGLTEDA